MRTLSNPRQTPKGGFHYRQPETGKEFFSLCHQAIMDQIGAHRAKHGLDVFPGWQSGVEDAMCDQNGWGGAVCQEVPEATARQIRAGDVKNFLSVLYHAISQGGSFVPTEEATRRAAICAGCPHNIDVPGCLGMCPGSLAKSLLRFMAAFHGKTLTTPHDAELKSCGICGCANSAQVHVDLATLRKIKGGFTFPEHCWKH